jgi:N-acetylneuraminic acid mutarotase
MHVLRSRLLLGAGLALLLGSIPTVTFAQGQVTWTSIGSMPYERSEITLAAAGGKLYVIGGQMRGVNANSINQEYDPVTKTWREAPLMPQVTSHAGSTVLNGRIIVVGGFQFGAHGGAVRNVFEFDPATDTWRALAPMSLPRGAPGVVTVNGKVYAVGGRNPDQKTVDFNEVYDPVANTWTTLAPLPAARDHLGIAALNGKVYVFGGRFNATVDNTTRLDIYDPATNTWSAGAPMNVARSAGVNFVINGKIIYAGGECKDQSKRLTFDDAEMYDPVANTWTMLPPMPVGRHAAYGTTLDNVGYVMGGAHGCGMDRMSKDITTLTIK